MKEIYVYNPAAGRGNCSCLPENVYYTTCPGDCRRYITQECLQDPSAHFTVYGGDGTLNEAVCGIMDAQCGKSAYLTAVASGSGNDTVKTLPSDKGLALNLDVIKHNDQYSINMLNMGFDCNVVATHSKIKKKFKIAGKISYILGVIVEFFKPFGENFSIEATTVGGETFSYSGPTLLCCVCNGQWCGGSFHNSPASDISDGVLELMLVKKMSRLKFLNLIGKYKKGTLVDKNTKKVAFPKYEEYVIYKRIKSLKISGCKQICFDGEIDDCTSADITIIPGAIKYRL